jgi:membrane protein YqaA with SNARE-associated domain
MASAMERATVSVKDPAGRDQARKPPLSERILRFAVRHGSRPRTLGLLSALSVGDFFLPALPTQTSVIALGLLQPQRAPWIALAFALAAGAGVGAVALLLTFVDAYADTLAQESLGQSWAGIAQTIRDYGVWAVFFASIFPTPPRTMVVAALLAGAAAPAVIAAVFCGKALWFGGVLTLLRYAPAKMRGLPLIGRQLRTLEALRMEHEHAAADAAQAGRQ